MKSEKRVITKGFTLIELLIVIGIIGVLASVIFVSLTSAKIQAKKSSALASAKSVMEELVTCHEDDGDAILTAPIGGTTPICCIDGTDGTTCSNVATDAVTGHNQIWPDVSPTDWTYDVPTGDLFNGDYVYTLSGPNADTITCTFSTRACN